ncbi:MAG TPA: hypothetical protein VEU07_10870, partial [Candidatus Acidoferrum sp.]|nr:hypothetical protein [Candidatus Acidoferrum sp.]
YLPADTFEAASLPTRHPRRSIPLSAVRLKGGGKRRSEMQAYEVEFAPAQLHSLHIKDAIRAAASPFPHVSVGDPATPGRGLRVPLTTRLMASLAHAEPAICRAKAYRDPKTHRVVLGVEQAEDVNDPRALVLLAASSSFPDGVSILPQEEVILLAKGEVRNGQQLLLIWPEGGRVAVDDPAREERYELRRAGDQFDRVKM